MKIIKKNVKGFLSRKSSYTIAAFTFALRFFFACFFITLAGLAYTQNDMIWYKADNAPALPNVWNDSGTEPQGTDAFDAIVGGSDNLPTVQVLDEFNFNPSVNFIGGVLSGANATTPNDPTTRVELTTGYYTIPEVETNTFNFDANGITILAAARRSSSADSNIWQRIIEFSRGALAQNILFSRMNNTDALTYSNRNLSISGGIADLNVTGGFPADQTLVMYSYQDAENVAGVSSSGEETVLITTTNIQNLEDTNRRINYIARSAFATDFVLTGNIAEIIVFNTDVLSDTLPYRSYLAIKYGVTLGDSDSDIDYVNSSNVTVWSYVNTYTNRIFGIGHDSGTGLDQRVSRSTQSDASTANVILSTNNDFTSANAGITGTTGRVQLGDGNYLLIGDNDAVLTNGGEAIPNTVSRVTREWRVQETGSVPGVFMQISNLPALTGTQQYALFTDTDDDFSSGAGVLALSTTGVFTNVDFTDSNISFFTIGIISESPTITISSVTDAEEPSTNGVFRIETTMPLSNDVTISYTSTTSSNFATAGVDYATLTNSVILPSGSTTADVIIVTIDDNIVELDESIQLTLVSTSSGIVSIGNSNSATITIIENDSANITISDASASESEGSIIVTLTLDSEVSSAFTVTFSTLDDGSALVTSDYTAITAQEVVFAGAANETRVITITINNDAVIEVSETLQLRGIASSNPLVANNDTALITIINDDAPNLVVSLVTSPQDGRVLVTGVAELGSTVTITFPNGSIQQVTANSSDGSYALTSTNRIGSGTISATSNSVDAGLLGPTNQPHNVFDFGDSPDNGTEIASGGFRISETIYLGSVFPDPDGDGTSNAGNFVNSDWDRDDTSGIDDEDIFANTLTVVTMRNDYYNINVPLVTDRDARLYGWLTTTPPNHRYQDASSGFSGLGVFPANVNDRFVAVTNGSNAASMTFIISNNSPSNEDVSLRFIFTDAILIDAGFGVDQRSLFIGVNDDGEVEDHPVRIIIVDPAQTTISASPAAVNGDGISSSIITVQLIDANGNNIVDTNTLSVSLTEDSDTANLGPVSRTGEGTFSAVITNSVAEIVTISGVINGVTITATINDNATVTFTSSLSVAALSTPINEADDGTFRLTLSNPLAETLSVSYLLEGTATNGTDYDTLTGVVAIPAGSTSFDIDLIVTDDLLVESDETVVLTLVSTSADTVVNLSNSTAEIEINDNDIAQLTIIDATESESAGQIVVNVTLDRGVQGGFTATLGTVAGTARNRFRFYRLWRNGYGILCQ